MDKGDEFRVAEVNQKEWTVTLGSRGRLAAQSAWARSGGVEVYRVESMELRAGGRIRWTPNDTDLGLVNS